VSAIPFPPHEQRAKAVVPRVRSLNDPTSRLATYPANEWRLPAATNVRSNSASAKCWSDVRVVIALVEADVFGATRTARAAQRDGVQHGAEHRAVGDVGTGDQCGEWHAAPVGQNVPFYATFRPVRRVGPSEVPPFGAFTEALSSELHFQAMPRRPS
jgi:hypothetical protein